MMPAVNLCVACGDIVSWADRYMQVVRPVVGGVPWGWVRARAGGTLAIAAIVGTDIRLESGLVHWSCAGLV